MSDTGKKYDGNKVSISIVPLDCIEKIAEAMEFGAVKYGLYNYLKVVPLFFRYLSAFNRHALKRFVCGEKYDMESGLLHTAHMATCALFILHRDILSGDSLEIDSDEDIEKYLSLKIERYIADTKK